jgi:hypothetical protein
MYLRRTSLDAMCFEEMKKRNINSLARESQETETNFLAYAALGAGKHLGLNSLKLLAK